MRRDSHRGGGVTLTQLLVILSLAALIGGSGAWAVKSYQASEQKRAKPQQPPRLAPQQPTNPCTGCPVAIVDSGLAYPPSFATLTGQQLATCKACYAAYLNANPIPPVSARNPVVWSAAANEWGYYVPGGSSNVFHVLTIGGQTSPYP